MQIFKLQVHNSNKRWNKLIKNQIKIVEIMKEWIHGYVMKNVRKIKIKMENIWIDLIRSIYAPYRGNSNISHNNGSQTITPTPGNAPTLGRIPNSNPGGTPNPSSDPNPDSDVDSDLSHHKSFQSCCLRHGRVPEPNEMIANAMSNLIDFIMKDKQEGKNKSKRGIPLTGTGYNKSSILNLDKHTA